jgi:hypothetical protein
MLPLQIGNSPSELKSPSHVSRTFFPVEFDLGRGGTDPDQEVRQEGEPIDLPEGSGDDQGLVELPVAQSPGVEGNGKETVRRREGREEIG